MVLNKFNAFYALAEEVPCILNIMVEENFKLFLNQTGKLPKLNERELESLRQYLFNRYSDRLQILKGEFIEELQISNISTSNDNQLKEYCKLLLNKLDPISNCLFEGSFIREIEENNLYPIPLDLLNHNGANDEIKGIIKLHKEPLKRLRVYTDEEIRTFKLLTNVFHQNYWSYKVIAAARNFSSDGR